MQKDIHYYRYLAEKYIQDRCTPEELNELFDYFETPASNRLLLEKIREQFQLSMETQRAMPEGASDRIEQKLMRNISDTRVSAIRRIMRLAAAVAVLLILSGGIYFLVHQKTVSLVSVARSQQVKKVDVLPGTNKAMLTLANGAVIALDSMQNGMLASQGGSRILKVNNGELTYDNSGSKDSKQVLYNTITVPRGGEYRLVLPDGSKVWLNAASSLRFPVSFSGRERAVELSGEAYFEIAENKNMPFKVMAGNMKVVVLGTHFNVKAYSDEAVIKTTLLEGAVDIINGNNRMLLKPGQQAQLFKAKGAMNKVWIDTSMAVAWKNGVFSFNSTSIYDIMREISRWYNVDVSYKDSLKVYLNGRIHRNVNVSQVFNILELTKEVHFKISGNKIVVSK
jgi:hypothetical protein